MEAKLNELALPGETFTPERPPKGIAIIGLGLQRYEETNDLLVTKPGILRHKPPNMYWMDCIQDKYVPKRGDFVVGVVARRAGESFKIDINAAEQALLSVYAFEGASKKQKPDIRIGDVIYARILTARNEMEPDVVCVDKYLKAKNMGKLSNGFVMRIPINLAYRFLSGENDLLETLGKKIVFETAIGINGRVWINARTTNDITKIMNAFRNADLQTSKSITDICRRHK